MYFLFFYYKHLQQNLPGTFLFLRYFYVVSFFTSSFYSTNIYCILIECQTLCQAFMESEQWQSLFVWTPLLWESLAYSRLLKNKSLIVTQFNRHQNFNYIFLCLMSLMSIFKSVFCFCLWFLGKEAFLWSCFLLHRENRGFTMWTLLLPALPSTNFCAFLFMLILLLYLTVWSVTPFFAFDAVGYFLFLKNLLP